RTPADTARIRLGKHRDLVALAAFHLPYRQGLLHYGSTLLRGLAERCRPSDLSIHDWNDWMDHLEAPLPEAVNRLLPSAFEGPENPARAIDH
ncbi:MAG: hypothetical protein ACKOKG_06645, partial [Verrucomicrobiota bacterium]